MHQPHYKYFTQGGSLNSPTLFNALIKAGRQLNDDDWPFIKMTLDVSVCEGTNEQNEPIIEFGVVNRMWKDPTPEPPNDPEALENLSFYFTADYDEVLYMVSFLNAFLQKNKPKTE